MNPAREGAAQVEMSRGVLAVSGPKRQPFLNALLSNEVASLRAGDGRLAALLDARGHVLALMRVLAGSDVVWLELPKERLATVQALLEGYRVAAPVRFAAPPTTVLAILGPAAEAVLASAGAERPPAAASAHVATTLAGAEVRVARASDLPASALAIHVPAASARAVTDALAAAGAPPLAGEPFDALRVEEGCPLYGVDVAEDNLLHETGLLALYHAPAKGCYVGQETVARLEARGGNVSRALRGLVLSRRTAAGATIRADDREVGRITTAAESDRLGPIAMGYVHRSHFAPGTPVSVDGASATVVALPLGG